MMSPRRYTDFGLQSGRDVRRRELSIRKEKGAPFGMKLMWFDHELYVMQVSKHAGTATEEVIAQSLQMEKTLGTTAAWRAGLGFADRIDAIGERQAAELAQVDLRTLYTELMNAMSVTLAISERPLFTTHLVSRVAPEGHTGLGIAYAHHRITGIETHSSAHTAGLKKGSTIIEIDGHSTLGLQSGKVCHILACAASDKPIPGAGSAAASEVSGNTSSESIHTPVGDPGKSGTAVEIVTMPHKMAAKFQTALRDFIAQDLQFKAATKSNLYTFTKDGMPVPHKAVKVSDYVDATLKHDRRTSTGSTQVLSTQPNVGAKTRARAAAALKRVMT